MQWGWQAPAQSCACIYLSTSPSAPLLEIQPTRLVGSFSNGAKPWSTKQWGTCQGTWLQQGISLHERSPSRRRGGRGERQLSWEQLWARMQKGPTQGWQHREATEEAIWSHWLGMQGWRKKDSLLYTCFFSYSRNKREVSCFYTDTFRKSLIHHPKLYSHPAARAELPLQWLPWCCWSNAQKPQFLAR